MTEYELYNFHMEDNELMHFGVKGMHWGVRKDPYSGYNAKSRPGAIRKQSFKDQRADLKKLRDERRQTGDASEYKRKRNEMIRRRAAERGKALVEANETYHGVLLKEALKTGAVSAGATLVGSLLAGPAGGVAIGSYVGAAYSIGSNIRGTRKVYEMARYRVSSSKKG